MAKGLPSVVEVLKKQLSLSESTIKDLKEEIRGYQRTLEQLTHENRELKNMIQVTNFKRNSFLFRTDLEKYRFYETLFLVSAGSHKSKSVERRNDKRACSR